MTRAETRARILAAAETQFIAFGYARTTMDHLAEILGISKRTLYEHYGSKEKLFHAMMKEKARELTRIREEILKSNKPVVEKLMLVGQTVHRSQATVFNATLFNDVKRNAPALWQQIKDIRREKLRTLWEEILAQGIKSGEFRKELSTDFIVTAFLAAVDKMLEPEFMVEGTYSMAQSSAMLMDIFLNGICTPKAKRSYSTHSLHTHR